MSINDTNLSLKMLEDSVDRLPPKQVQIPGPSAYEDALAEGFHGSRKDWLKSLRGPEGKSAYEVAVDNGYEGTEEDWVDTLGAPKGLELVGRFNHPFTLNEDPELEYPRYWVDDDLFGLFYNRDVRVIIARPASDAYECETCTFSWVDNYTWGAGGDISLVNASEAYLSDSLESLINLYGDSYVIEVYR